MSKGLSSDEKQIVQHLHFSNDMSGRAIAKLLGKPKSTVNDYLYSLRNNTVPVPEGAKVLIYDIETAPNIAYHWRRFRENIGQPQVIQESFLLTWSAKWLGTDEVISDSLHFHTNGVAPDEDYPVVASLWRLLDEADIIVAHNGDRFDEPTLNARALYHGFIPPHPAKTVDTLKIAKNRFRFQSNSLDAISQYLGIEEQKGHVDFSLWRRCMEGEVEAFEEMLEYNIQDVAVLEAVYLKLRAWDRRHPNVNIISGELDELRCGVCGSDDMESTGKFAYTNVSKFPTYRCNCCGAVKRVGQTVLSKEERTNLLRNVAR